MSNNWNRDFVSYQIYIKIIASIAIVICLGVCVYFGTNKSVKEEPVIEPSEEIIFEVNDTPMPEDIVIEEVDIESEEGVEEYIEDQAEEYYEEPTYYYELEPYSGGSGYSENTGGLTKSGGVNYYNDRKETWYSSNVLYHYRTPEWTVDEYGVYRDSDGYVVVAASDIEQGSEVDTSFGMGKVYDSGCAAGTTDIYVAW